MSSFNFYRNTFLEKEELSNLQNFLSNPLLMQLILNTSYSFGLITNNPIKFNPDFVLPEGFVPNDPFKAEPGTAGGTVKILPGMALNKLGQIISIPTLQDNIAVPQDGVFYWTKISYRTKNYENGLVNVNQKGNVTGTVDFTNKARGQSGSTPVVIRFEKDDGSEPINNGVYQIVSVINNQNLILTCNTEFVAENNLRVVILGTIPLRSVFSKEQMSGIYTYDFYKIELIKETDVTKSPDKLDTEFYVSKVRNNEGNVVVDNSIKNEYWSLAGFK